MKKTFTTILTTIVCSLSFASTTMEIHTKQGTETIPTNTSEKIKFSNGVLSVSDNSTSIFSSVITDIDSITFATQSNKYIQVTYNSNGVQIVNPFEAEGVEVTAEGGHVNVTSTTETKNIKFYMTGECQDGSFTITPSKRFSIIMDNLNLTNPNGSAIAILEDKACYITAINSKLSSGAVDAEHNAIVWSKTQIIIGDEVDEEGNPMSGGIANGSLTIGTTDNTSVKNHGIFSSDYVAINSGNLKIIAGNDGINTKDYVEVNGGSLNIQCGGDGLDCNDQIYINGGETEILSTADDAKGLKCDSIIDIAGGVLSIEMSGNGSKGIKNNYEDIKIANAKVSVKCTGTLFVEPNGETSYTAGIKTDNNLKIKDSDVTIYCGPDATGTKGLNATSSIAIEKSTVNITVTGLKDENAVSGGKVVGIKSDGALDIDAASNVIVECTYSSEKGVKHTDTLMTNGVVIEQ